MAKQNRSTNFNYLNRIDWTTVVVASAVTLLAPIVWRRVGPMVSDLDMNTKARDLMQRASETVRGVTDRFGTQHDISTDTSQMPH